jgi:hypothetical protein
MSNLEQRKMNAVHSINMKFIQLIDYSQTVEVDPAATVRVLTSLCNQLMEACMQKAMRNLADSR